MKAKLLMLIPLAGLVLLSAESGSADTKKGGDRFSVIDSDGDGTITFAEFKTFHEELRLQLIFKHLDKDENNIVDANEFIEGGPDRRWAWVGLSPGRWHHGLNMPGEAAGATANKEVIQNPADDSDGRRAAGVVRVEFAKCELAGLSRRVTDKGGICWFSA